MPQPLSRRSWSWMVLWRPTKPSRTPKKMSFSYRGLECKSRKSRDIWGNRQVWPWSTKWSRAKSNRVLWREYTGHSKYPFSQQYKRWHYIWTSPDGQNLNQIDYILWSWIWRSWIQSAKTRPGPNCGYNHKPLNAKFRLKLKKEGEIISSFRYT